MNQQGATRLAARPDGRPDPNRDRDAIRRERMAAPLDFRSVAPAGPPTPQHPALHQPGSQHPLPQHPLPQPRRLSLTATGTLLAVTVPTVLAAAIDSLLTGSVHWIFGIVFVAAAFHAATLIRRRDLLAGLIVPPIAYSAGLLTAVQFGAFKAGTGFLGQLASVGALLALKPRPLFLGTGLAAALLAARWAGSRRTRGADTRH